MENRATGKDQGRRQFAFLFVYFLCFLGLHLWHMGVPRLGVESELQLPSYATATAMGDPSCVCDLHRSSWQCQILNPLSKARDRTHILLDTSWIAESGGELTIVFQRGRLGVPRTRAGGLPLFWKEDCFINLFHLLGGLVLRTNSKILLSRLLEEEPGPCPKAALLCLNLSSLVPLSPPFPD